MRCESACASWSASRARSPRASGRRPSGPPRSAPRQALPASRPDARAVARRRLDAELVRRGLVATRSEAQSAVRDGLVLVSGRSASKPSTLVDAAAPLKLVGAPRRFASPAGEKLEAALERFAIDVQGRDGLDAGASTGGFTDCLLRRGAAHVGAGGVGYRELRPAASRPACSVEVRRTWWRSTSGTGSSPGRSGPTNASPSSNGPTFATCVP